MKTFTRVAELQSFVKAARSLEISPAMASRRVADLESHLEIRLLNRSTRRVELSEAGERYYPQCVTLLENLESLEADVSSLGASPSGLLRVSAPMDFAQLYLRPAVREFLSICPDVRIELHLEDRQVHLLDQQVDVAIRVARLEDSSLIARKLGEACIGCYAAPDYLAIHGAPSSPIELASHTVMTYALSSAPGKWQFTENSQARTVDVRWRLSVNNGRMMADAASRGLGIVQLPEFLVRDHVKDGRLLEILGDYRSPALDISAVYMQRKFKPAKITAFVDYLASYFDQRKGCFEASVY